MQSQQAQRIKVIPGNVVAVIFAFAVAILLAGALGYLPKGVSVGLSVARFNVTVAHQQAPDAVDRNMQLVGQSITHQQPSDASDRNNQLGFVP